MSFADVRACVSQDIAVVESLILERCRTDIDLINDLIDHIMKMGGKRIRPILVCLVRRALQVSGAGVPDNSVHLNLAAIVEMIHAATLLHDDVIDHAEERRCQPTAHTVWGNQVSILGGDHIYATCFGMMVDLDDSSLLKVLSSATSVIVQGELLQLSHQGQGLITMEAYEQVIHAKTAMLFEVCCRVAAMASGVEQKRVDLMADYGRYLGVTYQLVDDTLDYFDSQGKLGKKAGNDWLEGRATLPLLLLAQQLDDQGRQQLSAMLAQHERPSFTAITEDLRRHHIYERCCDCVEQHLRQALRGLDDLPANSYTDALRHLTDLLRSRVK